MAVMPFTAGQIEVLRQLSQVWTAERFVLIGASAQSPAPSRGGALRGYPRGLGGAWHLGDSQNVTDHAPSRKNANAAVERKAPPDRSLAVPALDAAPSCGRNGIPASPSVVAWRGRCSERGNDLRANDAPPRRAIWSRAGAARRGSGPGRRSLRPASPP